MHTTQLHKGFMMSDIIMRKVGSKYAVRYYQVGNH